MRWIETTRRRYQFHTWDKFKKREVFPEIRGYGRVLL